MTTINLIPPKIKRQQRAKRLSKVISSALFSILIMILIVFMALYTTDRFLKSELSSSTQNLADTEYKLKSFKDIEDRIGSINTKLLRLNTLKSQNIVWTDVIEKIGLAVPDKVQISGVQMDATGKKFTLSGIAPSRREIVMLQTKLEDSDYFSGVTFGSSSLDDKTNTFTFSLTGDFKK